MMTTREMLVQATGFAARTKVGAHLARLGATAALELVAARGAAQVALSVMTEASARLPASQAKAYVAACSEAYEVATLALVLELGEQSESLAKAGRAADSEMMNAIALEYMLSMGSGFARQLLDTLGAPSARASRA